MKVDRRTFIQQMAAAGAVVTIPGAIGCREISEVDARPNFVIILADDLGYGDLASYGNQIIQTPNIDRLATQGMRFTDFHSAGTVCSPSRASMLTGRNPYRSGFYYIAGSGMHLQRDEITVASLLSANGYDTCFVGKWHLSHFDRESSTLPTPGDHGFDHWFATAVNAFEGPENPNTFFRNGERVGEVDGWYCDVIVEEALTWLRNRPDPDKPYFLYLCSHEPHTPVEPPDSYADAYETEEVEQLSKSVLYGGVQRPDRDINSLKKYYYGTVTQLDHAFGVLMKGLDSIGDEEKTLVIFTSDNGPESPVNMEESRGEWDDFSRDRSFGTPGRWRGMKRYPYEGGHRVPGIARWTGHIAPGTVNESLINGTDFFPTLMELAGVALPADRALDGVSMMSAFRGQELQRPGPVYWFFPAHEDTYYRMPHMAMRDGDYTLLAWLPEKDPDQLIMDWLKTSEPDRFVLFNLKTDPAQVNDLSKAEPQRLAGMSAQMRTFWAEIKDDSPYWETWKMK
jgi:arylsulfatase A